MFDHHTSIEEVNKIQSVDQVSFDRNNALIETIREEIDQRYLQKIRELSISREAIQRQHDLKIVFSPIHGTGITLVPKALQSFGFTQVTLVEEQCTTDGNFPTVVYPNPEEEDAACFNDASTDFFEQPVNFAPHLLGGTSFFGGLCFHYQLLETFSA